MLGCHTSVIYKMGAVTFVNITGYERFNHYVDNLPEKHPKVCLYFAGKKDENGHSFCIYCQMGSKLLPSTSWHHCSGNVVILM